MIITRFKKLYKKKVKKKFNYFNLNFYSFKGGVKPALLLLKRMSWISHLFIFSPDYGGSPPTGGPFLARRFYVAKSSTTNENNKVSFDITPAVIYPNADLDKNRILGENLKTICVYR